MSWLFGKTQHLPAPDEALPGRDVSLPVPRVHEVLGHPLAPPYPDHLRTADFALGCFWGAEELFWQLEGVWTTAVGYAGGHTPNPTYEEVCSGRTGHAEAVRVVYDPDVISYEALLKVFWENHDPTQGMRQGNDVGTQYRSAVYVHDAEQRAAAEASRKAYDAELRRAGHEAVTTDVVDAGTFYFAEDYHQQYLSPSKNLNGYRCHSNTGVPFPTDKL